MYIEQILYREVKEIYLPKGSHDQFCLQNIQSAKLVEGTRV